MNQPPNTSRQINHDRRPAGMTLDGRGLLVAGVIFYAITLGVIAAMLGPTKAQTLSGVLPMGTPFSDLYIFPSAQQELATGGNPYLQNPTDPWHRLYNYPRIWLTVMRYPADWIPFIGCIMALAWVASLLHWWGRLTPSQGLAGAMIICSPSVLLAVERANTDLIIFLMILGMLGSLHRGWLHGAWFAWGMGFVCKLYPVAVLPVFLRIGWRRAWPWLAAGTCLVVVHSIWRVDEIRTIAQNTDTGMWMSYGSTNWTKAANRVVYKQSGRKGAFQAYTWPSILAAGLLFTCTYVAGWRRPPAKTDPPPNRFLDGFHAGAFIYALTFTITSSFVYRLIFLLLCIPWLWQAFHSVERGLRNTRLLCLSMIGGILWLNPLWWFPLIIGREACAWVLLAGLGWLLGVTTRTVHGPALIPRIPDEALKHSEIQSPKAIPSSASVAR